MLLRKYVLFIHSLLQSQLIQGDILVLDRKLIIELH